MIPSKQEILDRYTKVEKFADDLGRVIVVGRLRPSQDLNVTKLADTSDNYVQYISRAAASVRMIDDVVYTPPRTKSELDAIIDALDEEGLRAAAEAFRKLFQKPEEAVGIDAAKNSL